MTRPTAGRLADGGAANGSGKITREVVLAAALEIIDRDGAAALSMRRLAAALDRDPTILYRHAPTRRPARRRHFDRPRPAHGRLGRPRLGQPAACRRRDYRALALARPDVVPLLVTRPPATPLALRPQGTLRPLEDVLTLLTRAGFSGPDALHIYRALFGFLHGHVVNELQELVEKPEETDDLLRL
jgi:AcrR family transcriptional regulator